MIDVAWILNFLSFLHFGASSQALVSPCIKYLKKNMNSPAVGIDIGESENVAHFVSVPQKLSILALG